MKTVLWTVVAVLSVACSYPISPTQPPALPAETFTLTGTVSDLDGDIVPAPRMQLTDLLRSLTRVVTGDDRGTYRVENVSGQVIVSASRDGYYSRSINRVVGADTVLDLKLERVHPTIIGEIVHGLADGDPYDPVAWDARAPCRRYPFVAPGTGTIEFTLTWTGSSDLDLLIPTVGYWGSAQGMVHVAVPVLSGQPYEVVVNSYYAVVDFKLRSVFHAGN